MNAKLYSIERFAQAVEQGMLAVIPPLVLAVIVLFLFAALA